MRRLGLSGYAFSISAVAVLLAGCGSQTATPGAMPLNVASKYGAHTASQQALIYGISGNTVSIYDYPSLNLDTSFTLNYNNYSSCSDSQGNVYLAGNYKFKAIISKYSYGGTSPSATLSTVKGFPASCSVDSTMGNVAMAVDPTYYKGFYYVVVYPNFTGRGTEYKYPTITHALSLSYDDSGDLFLLGSSHCRVNCKFSLAELPKGGSAFEPISGMGGASDLGEVQWDGTYLAVGACPKSIPRDGCTTSFKVDRLSISGSSAQQAGSIKYDNLLPRSTVFKYPDTWIQPNLGILVAAKPSSGGFSIWEYPGGGHVSEQISSGSFGSLTVAVPSSQ